MVVEKLFCKVLFTLLFKKKHFPVKRSAFSWLFIFYLATYSAGDSGSTNSTGLGLSFCKLAIEAHGGEMSVKSVQNQETTFSFSLPLSQTNSIQKLTKIQQKETEFNEDELRYLSNFVARYKKYDVYEVIPLREITKDIDSNFSENIYEWKSQIEKAIYNCNESEYLKIIERIQEL